MNKIYNQCKLLIWGSMALGAMSACSNDTALEDINDSDGPNVEIVSATVESRAADINYVTPNDGTYYLYYKNNGSANLESKTFELKSGTFSGMGKTDLLWGSVQEEFILSNTENIMVPATINNNTAADDIVHQKNNFEDYGLSFILTHRMAQTKVNLTLPEGWSIVSVSLNNLKNKYTFENSSGDVVPYDNKAKLSLTKVDKEDAYFTLLPPQEKEDDSELYVTVNDGKDNLDYHHLLPYSMREDMGNNQWQDVPLKFTAGHTLQLNATITGGEPEDIYFTYATLVNWTDIGTYTIPNLRQAGIYTVKDMNAWIAAWNADDQIRLRKYGKQNDGGKWEFVLKANIDLSAVSTQFAFKGSGNTTKNNFFVGKPKNTTWKFTQKTAEQLGLDDASLYETDLF